jgi:aminopeptidase-like protein
MVTMDDRDEQLHAVQRGGADLHDAAQSRNDRVLRRLTRVLPIARSLTGDGVRATLAVLAEELPIEVHEIASGTEVLDWTVPDEWNLRRATLTAPDGTVVADTDVHPLHVVGYSDPVELHIDRATLDAHLHSLPDRPDAIPYRTSYYHRTWGFCLPHRVREALPDGTYHARIDATLAPGALTLAELVIPGRTGRELLLTTHICHPAMANDNASGITVLAEVARELLARTEPLQHTVRCLFLPGSLGAITWLATHRDVVPRIAGGLVLTGLGDRGPLRYKRSRRGDTPIDRAAELVLAERGADLGSHVLEFSPYGYDERQFCSPGFDLAVGRLTRGVHGTFPEYHTSLDDLSFVDATQLDDAVGAVCTFVEVVDRDRTYVNLAPFGEPQLGRRGLYATVGGLVDARSVEMGLLWVLNQSDGTRSLVDIARRSGLPFRSIASAADALLTAGLLDEA